MHPTVSQELIDSVHSLGFAMVPRILPDATIERLASIFSAAEDSPHARKRDGNTYALRNILNAIPGIREFALTPEVFEPIRSILGEDARPVKAILFDKTPAVNWNLRWHQDNVIAVADRKDVAGFTAWSERVGIPHVRPPVNILEQMLAARIHIDDCPAENGALQVIPGTHLSGRLSDDELERAKRDNEPIMCTAQRGEILLMRPLLVHSSRPSTTPSHRRVLHIEYAACDLPGGLEWGA